MTKSVKSFAKKMISFQVGIFLAGYGLLQKLLEPSLSVQRSQEPTTLSRRGSYVPYLLGRRRIGPVFGAAGLRKTASVSGAIKYREDGWHQLSVGQGFGRLHRIWRRGEVIWEGPIDSLTTPSGTVIDLGDKHGSFAIFWGESDQPVNTLLANDGLLGISSAWPFVDYVLWDPFNLGFSPSWDELEYDFEDRPLSTGLTKTPTYMESTRKLTGTEYPIVAFLNGHPGDASVTIAGKHADELAVGWYIKIVDDAASPRDYLIQSITQTSSPPRTILILGTGLSGADGTGSVATYELPFDDGMNPAHAIWQMLFAPWPRGLGRDVATTDVDIASLETLGQLCAKEHLAGSILGQAGRLFGDMIGSILADIGAVWSRDPQTGKLAFLAVRQTTEVPPTLKADIQTGALPQLANVLALPLTTTIAYSFDDRARSFARNAITLDDDGAASAEDNVSASVEDIQWATDIDTATRIASRRDQERQIGGANVTVKAGREARLTVPGQLRFVEGVPYAVRVVSVQVEQLTSAVTILGNHDVYGVPASAYLPGDGSVGDPTFDDPDEDLAFDIVECPAALLAGSPPIALLLLRIRAHAQIISAAALLSPDNDAYAPSNGDIVPLAGGRLVELFAIDAGPVVETGPTFTALGPDLLDKIVNLAADPVGWTSGKQCLWIDGEWCFLREVVALGGGIFRLDGIIRARFESVPALHLAGTTFYVFDAAELARLGATWLAPNVDVYAKSQPSTTDLVPLEDIDPDLITLYGYGIVPREPGPFITAELNDTWIAGGDLVVSWGWSTGAAGAGAGAFPVGFPQVAPLVPGQFVISICDIAGVQKRLAVALVPTYTYVQAIMAFDFGAEPAEILFKVFHVNNGYASPLATYHVSKL